MENPEIWKDAAYKKPPNVQPKNGAIMGTWMFWSGMVLDLRSGLAYPEVIVASRPHVVTISKEVRHQTWTEITSKIDRIAGLELSVWDTPIHRMTVDVPPIRSMHQCQR